MQKSVIFIVSLASMITANAQFKKNYTLTNDSLPNSSSKDSNKLRLFSELTSKAAVKKSGLINTYQLDNQYYFEIPDSLLDKDILVVSRISNGPADIKLYPGDEISNMVVRFKKIPNNRLIIQQELFQTHVGDSTASMYNAVVRSEFMPIIASFNIEAYNHDSSGIIVCVTDMILSDNEIFSLNPFQKVNNYLTTLAADKSFISQISNFPVNLEITTTKTYIKSQQIIDYSTGNRQQVQSYVSLQLNTSFILLPLHPLQQRFADDRIGYFSLKQTDYDINPNGIKERKYIIRWKLEPKIKDIEKYIKGELVEPEHPIIFYIDPATPSKWVNYLIQGVNDWQQAFEIAGFKNAIFARKAPEKDEDSTWSLNDARHSAIVYKPSAIENASGPSICDPRSGEILESHINFYHNVIQLVHDWYMIQCGAVDVNAQRMIFNDSLLGKLIRSVISHEVGHTLGLMHNWRASSTVPVDSLRNKKWVEANGFCPSIMDYARFNYVAQPEDSINESGLLPRIGVYDKWAIEFGYRWHQNFSSAEAELNYYSNWITTKLKDKQLIFGSEHNFGDPSIQSEDLGDNPVLASYYGIKNLKRIIPNLIKWTKVHNEGYNNLNEIYNGVQAQMNTYIRHVLTIIGGIHESIKYVDEPGPIYSPISIARQKEALSFLNKNLFTTPMWLIDTAILNRTGQTAIGVIGGIQEKTIFSLFYPPLIFASMLSRNESSFGEKETYTIMQLLKDLRVNVWSELRAHTCIDLYRRTLQKTYIVWLKESYKKSQNGISLILPISGATNLYSKDIVSFLYGHLKELQKDIKNDIPYIKDNATKFHLEYIYDQINDLWKESIVK